MRTIAGLVLGPALLWGSAASNEAPEALSPPVDNAGVVQQAAEQAQAPRTRQQEIAAMRRALEAKLRFLHRAHRAFFAAHMSTTDVKARIAAAERRLADLERGADDPARQLPEKPDRTELQAELAFLERAHRAFFAAHHSTTEVKRRIREIEKRLDEIGGGPATGGRQRL